jgi:hypothetical protein
VNEPLRWAYRCNSCACVYVANDPRDVACCGTSVTPLLPGELLDQFARVDALAAALIVERDTANRALFQAQEAAKDLAAQVDRLRSLAREVLEIDPIAPGEMSDACRFCEARAQWSTAINAWLCDHKPDCLSLRASAAMEGT